MADRMKEIGTRDPLVGNVFELIADRWMLVTAGTPADFNTMTASWGCLGELWSRDVCIAFVRPQRYTWEFMEKSPGFTLSFFGPEQRGALEFCGTHSGRDVDKMAETGLEPLELETPAGPLVAFTQAELIIAARKIYKQDITQDCFVDSSIAAEIYPGRDFHRIYVGEIQKVLTSIGES
jgi:flavin reductase (DIM6/NTAB) family NADH-FMN oxidoreductase RutF